MGNQWLFYEKQDLRTFRIGALAIFAGNKASDEKTAAFSLDAGLSENGFSKSVNHGIGCIVSGKNSQGAYSGSA